MSYLADCCRWWLVKERNALRWHRTGIYYILYLNGFNVQIIIQYRSIGSVNMDWVSLWRNGGMLMAGQAVDSGQYCPTSDTVVVLVLQLLTETLESVVVFVFLLLPPT